MGTVQERTLGSRMGTGGGVKGQFSESYKFGESRLWRHILLLDIKMYNEFIFQNGLCMMLNRTILLGQAPRTLTRVSS